MVQFLRPERLRHPSLAVVFPRQFWKSVQTKKGARA
jgi:hypothetical protein